METHLTIKELAPYLPYGLELYNRQSFTRKMHALESGDKFVNIEDVDCLNFKPILRPLSDLTKEIEVNGEKFVPIEYIKINFECFNFDYDDTFILGEDSVNYKYLPFMIIFKLLKWHFDIFGLIEKGLAIDKNTL